MIASIAMFNTYSGNFEDSAEAVLLKQAFLGSAEEITVSYLGFDPNLRAYTDLLASGTGMRRLYLPVRNIASVGNLSIGAEGIDTTLLAICDDHLRFKDGVTAFPRGVDNIRLSLDAGWEAPLMPPVVTLSILRIATLMLSETGGNIGLTGKSFSDNSRTFVNYSNYRKYLQPLDALRLTGF
jgi:hypothetical protein